MSWLARAFFCLSLSVSVSEVARAEEPMCILPARSVASSEGLTLAATAGFIVPPEGGALGGAVAADLRYGLAGHRVVIAPGVRLEGSFARGSTVPAALATMRFSIPLQLLYFFAFGGAGVGYRNQPDRHGMAIEGGAGMATPLNGRWALAAEARYQQLLHQSFHSLFLGPSLTLQL